MPITAIYAGLLAFVLVALSARVIGMRRSAKVAVGDQGNPDLLRRIRAHANFTEYVPFALVLMGLAEGLKASPSVLHALGLVLLGGRLLHAFGISQSTEPLWMRVTGMTMTLTVILASALNCLLLASQKL